VPYDILTRCKDGCKQELPDLLAATCSNQDIVSIDVINKISSTLLNLEDKLPMLSDRCTRHSFASLQRNLTIWF
jgi:hypothetical protein